MKTDGEISRALPLSLGRPAAPPVRCWTEIDLACLRHNAEVARLKVGPATAIMAVVKADAYGHGATEIAAALAGLVDVFGVANVAEAREVTMAVPDAKVFILSPALPNEREEIVRGGYVPPVSSAEEAAAFGAYASDRPAEVHLVIDTGMGRVGICEDEAVRTACEIAALAQVRLTGIATHLPVADEDEGYTQDQLERFTTLVTQLRQAGVTAGWIHSLNSAGILAFQENAREMVRAGLMLYGSAPIERFQTELRPVMTLKSRVTLVRDLAAGRSISYGRTFVTPHAMRVATVGMGYADGYPRHLSGTGAEVLIRGRRCLLLGRVTMDQIVVDVTGLPPLEPGEEVVLFGRQGSDEILVSEVAKKAGTIAWEIFTGLGHRVQRISIDSHNAA